MPSVFRAVRGLSGLSEDDYICSVAGDFNFIEFLSNSKSGEFFFYTHDGKYMIKTQTRAECKLLRKIMPKYVEHLDVHPSSLLVRFYGMYRVIMPALKLKIHFVVMASVFDTDKPIHATYDLKGSTVGRLTDPLNVSQGAVQKDLNLKQSGRLFSFGIEQIELLDRTIKSDVALLASLNIMDYSLLIGIHEVSSQAQVGKGGKCTKSSKRQRKTCLYLTLHSLFHLFLNI